MHFICRSFIGKNTPHWWSQYWENEPDDLTKATKGHLFGVISLSSDNSDTLSQRGHNLINQINTQYFSESSDSTLVNLNQIVNKIHQQLNPDEKFSLVLVVIIKNQLFLLALGDIEVHLQRQNQISRLLKGNTNSPSVISGPIQNLDRVFIASSQFIQQFSYSKIKTILFDQKIQNIEESFLSSIYSLEDQTSLSAALIETHQEENIQSENSQPFPGLNEETLEVSPMPSNQSATPTIPSKNPSVYVRQRLNFKIGNHQKIRLFIALILLIGLSISFYFGHKKNLLSQAESNFSQYKTELEQKLNNISAIKSLDLDAAYSTAKEAQEIINNMASLEIHPDEVSQYQSQINSILSQTGDSSSFTPDMVYDTSLITSSPQFSQLLFFKDLLYLLDSSSGRIDTLNPSQKSTKNISISGSIKSAQKILLDNNQVYILSQNQVKSVGKDEISSKLNFDDHPSVHITDLQFWNGSVYVLDNSDQSIWKFTPNASGFSDPQDWLKNDLKLEIGSKFLAIDSRIWTLTSSGLIDLYISGLKDNFNQKQTFDISSASSFTTDSDSDYLVIADKSKFIYVYKKDGEFISKYNLDKFDVLDISLDPDSKIIYFLASDQKIYKITL